MILVGGWLVFLFFFKQKTAYEMCGRDWSSDVCSSDLEGRRRAEGRAEGRGGGGEGDLHAELMIPSCQ